MLRLMRFSLVLIVLLANLPATSVVVVATSVAPAPVGATEVATTVGAASTCEDGQQSSGALYRICMPASDAWNGDLVVFAHGYVAPDDPLEIPEDQMKLPGGMSMPEIANRLGFAFATTSYSTNGLAIREGVADVHDLVGVFTQTHGQPSRVYLVGGSEGGIVTALAVEQYPDVFDGGLAACGPVGDFRRQANYWGDFRVVFDYFFPDLIPGSPIDVPQEVMDNWDSVYVPAIQDAIQANPRATDQLLRVTHAATDRYHPDSVKATILGLLWYNVFATNDGITKLQGQPFDNSHRVYYGSYNDWRLNRQVQRFNADQSALDEIEAYYQTSGRLTSPLVTLHNTGDPFVPYWHEPLYRWKAFWNGSSLKHSNVPALRYGHCNFNLVEGVAAFAVLYLKVTGSDLLGVEAVLPDAGSQAKFQKLLQEYGAER
ncbi:MAG: alpha/beta hydrolase family protein [Anaerolineae bacterium]